MNLLSGYTLAGFALVGCFVLLLAELIFFFVLMRRRARYLWNFHGKEVVAEVRMGSAKLYVGGVLEDEFSGDRTRVCMLRALVDGTEVLVRVRFGFRLSAEASANGTPLVLMGAGK